MDYDFSGLEKSDKDEEKKSEGKIDDFREGFRITECCRNCAFFRTPKTSNNLGVCILSNPHVPDGFIRQLREVPSVNLFRFIYEKMGWLTTHSTNLCDKHAFKDGNSSVKPVESWTKKFFNGDGSIDELTDNDVFNPDAWLELGDDEDMDQDELDF